MRRPGDRPERVRAGHCARLLPTSRLAWALVLLAVASALCFVPLFNLLAFEFAFALALPVSFAAAVEGIRARRAHPDSAGRAWLRGGLWATALAALPLVPISLNALRVRNCDYLEGLAFYAALPLTTAWVAVGIGVGLARVFRRANLMFFLLFFGTILLALYRFLMHPPVDVFHVFLGYYPGSLYDEVVEIGGRLMWSRLEDLSLAAAVVVFSALGEAPRRRWLAGLALLGVVATWWAARVHAIHRDAAWVQAELGGHRATTHLDLYHPSAWTPGRVALLATDLEFAYSELASFLAVAPSERPAIYLYPDRDTKKRLMGAGSTRIAKPWQRAMHIDGLNIGDPVALHELAHVFSADLANGPFHLSAHGILPQMGLIEGLAVAATWESGRLDGHQWSAAMRRVGAAPPLDRLLSPTGFLTSYSRTAYTLCGSFVRFLHDTEGPEAVAATYRAGQVWPPDTLAPRVAAWESQLDALPLDPRALAEARDRFDRPAIFAKVCAHEVAALRRDAGRAIATGDATAGLAILDTLLGHVPGDVSARLTRISLLLALGRTAQALEATQEIAADEHAGAAARQRAREWLADLAAAGGQVAEATAQYDALLAVAYDRDQIRRLAVKRGALAGGPASAAILRLLTLPPGTPRAVADAVLDEAAAAAQGDAVVAYLLGRRHLQNRRFTDGMAALEAALIAGLTHPALRFEARRLLARAHFDQGHYLDAAVAFDALATEPDDQVERGERFELARWARRARFFAAAGVDKDQGHPEDAADTEEAE